MVNANLCPPAILFSSSTWYSITTLIKHTAIFNTQFPVFSFEVRNSTYSKIFLVSRSHCFTRQKHEILPEINENWKSLCKYPCTSDWINWQTVVTSSLLCETEQNLDGVEWGVQYLTIRPRYLKAYDLLSFQQSIILDSTFISCREFYAIMLPNYNGQYVCPNYYWHGRRLSVISFPDIPTAQTCCSRFFCNRR